MKKRWKLTRFELKRKVRVKNKELYKEGKMWEDKKKQKFKDKRKDQVKTEELC